MGKKWMWKFAYPGGPNAIGTLHVPAGRPVRLLMTSRDVIHSFYVPDFRIKQDVLPGRYTETWFEATKPGRYQIFCAEYCGTWHSQMWGEVVVMPAPSSTSGCSEQQAGLAERVDTGGDDGGSFRGSSSSTASKIAMAAGCLKCHSLDGAPHIGPTWLDLYHAPRDAGERPGRHRRRGLPHRFDDRSARQGREGLQAGDAHLQGQAGGAGSSGAGRVHQVAAQRKASRTSLEGSGL